MSRYFNRLRLVFVAMTAVAVAVTCLGVPSRKPQRLNAPRLRAVPTIPTANRAAGNRVILEQADNLSKGESDTFMVVSGNVRFSKGPMLMFCDSAHYYNQSGALDAFGNVRMQQGDTLFIYADELNYDAADEMAYLYGYDGVPVRMINREVKLETDIFTYDIRLDLGYYNTGGVLTDRRNRLESVEGEYVPSSKDANFYDRVRLQSLNGNDTLHIYTDTLFYNTATHLAEFNSPTLIVNRDGHINTTEGTYNTASEMAQLFSHSKVYTTRGTTLEGDTLLYDRLTGIGRAYGNMCIADSARQSALKGDFGYYDENIDSAFVTGHAVAMEYSREDTLYMHGRYITSVLRVTACPAASDTLQDACAVPDSTHILTAWPRVRFYRSDAQGLCDTMIYVEKDSVLHMRHHPVVWSGGRQVFGNVIDLYMNDSTVDRAVLPDFAFVAQLIEDPYYNQLTGKKMVAGFLDGHVRRLNVDGSVQAIFYPEESDSTINKMVYLESSFLEAWMTPGGLERMKTWPASSGNVTPLYLARRGDLLLPKFKWYQGMRPLSPEDIFVIPAEMEELMGNGASAAGANGHNEANGPETDNHGNPDNKMQAIKTDADE